MSEQLNFKLEIFEGPLDLMLSLISKHKLNIYDIEISLLLEQFMLYLEQMQQADIEIAGEFLETAARLIYMKSSALLPKAEIEEMKRELQGALIEYALCKTVAARLGELYGGDSIFVREPAETEENRTYTRIHDTDELFLAMSDINYKVGVKRSPPPAPPALEVTFVSVFSKIVYVLKKVMAGGEITVNELFKGQTRSQQVATFLALLELSKNSRIRFSHDSTRLALMKDGDEAEDEAPEEERPKEEEINNEL